MSQATQTIEKRAFTLLAKDGATPLVARIPVHLRIGDAVAELAAYAGYPAEPDISTRYALVAAASGTEGGYRDFVLLRDDQTFGDVDAQSLLRIAPQARPAGLR